MRKVTITCDKCKLLIEPLDSNFQGSGNSLSVLSYNGLLGHNQVPSDGWHFHYACLCEIVLAILRELNQAVKPE